MLAVGLVLATVGGVAVVGALVVGLPWAVAFVLGAVLGPTDPISASAILQRVGAPERIVTILEGEALVNDATAITAYTLAVTAVQTGRFSFLDGIGTFAFEVAAGIAIGLVAALVASRLLRYFDDPGVRLAGTLLTPFIAYIPADAIGASGVLAVVAAGLYAAASPESTAERLRGVHEARLQRLDGLLQSADGRPESLDHYRDTRRAVIAAQRRSLDELRAGQAYPASILREVGRDLDIEEAALHRASHRGPSDARPPPRHTAPRASRAAVVMACTPVSSVG
jgi:hypothetical protein